MQQVPTPANTNPPGMDGLIAITEAEFQNGGTEGVWRAMGEMSGLFSFSGEGFSTESTFNSFRHVIAHAEKTIDGKRHLDQCNLNGFQLYEDQNTTDEDASSCDGAAYSYYKSADGLTHYHVISCDGGGTSIYAFNMLSDIPEYDLGTGTVSFDSDAYPDVTTVSGICGSLMELDQQVEMVLPGMDPIAEDVLENEITVRVPYQDNYLFLDFKFDEQPVVGHEYTLMPYSQLEGTGQACLYVQSASAEFGATIEDVAVCRSESGSLTLTSFGETFAEGSFSATIKIADNVFENISGSFSISIE